MTRKEYSLGAGITLSGDAGLEAEVRLGQPQDPVFESAAAPVPPWFREESGAFESLETAEAGIGVLELSSVSGAALVTPENPLILTIEESDLIDEMVLPYAYDGEFFLPLGSGRAENGRVQIAIDSLPPPAAGDPFESLNSFKIMFQKIAHGAVGTGYDYPRLAAADVSDAGAVTYAADPAEVRRRAAEAQRILLYVHGLFGDTEGYVASAAAAEVKTGDPPKLKEKYDLILAYDYESINTPIEITARQLREALEAVGLGPNHGKSVHIVAHSLGGLVSRWFVEQEGGKEMVQHLVTAGTPHLGTPWPKVHSWATTMLALGLNGLSSVVWPVKIAASLLKATEAIDVTVDQMDPGSTFMQLLASNRDPGIPITLLAGNTSIDPAALQAQAGETSSVLERLLDRLEGMKLVEKAASLAFYGRPNDIAVSVESAFGVPEGHAQVTRVEIACDHMSFFLLADPLTRLAEALEA